MPQEPSVTSSCFDVEVIVGICKLELWPTFDAQEPIRRYFVGGEQSYFRYEGDFGPVRVEPKGYWSGKITYYDLISQEIGNAKF